MVDLWLAGMLEGEGTFHVRKDGGEVSIASTDFDVVCGVRTVAGMGTVMGPYAQQHWKPKWKWSISEELDILDLCERIRPYMYSRRKEQIDKLVQYYTDKRATMRYPKGVSKNGKGYRAYCMGKTIGTFPTAEQASEAYKQRRRQLRKEIGIQ